MAAIDQSPSGEMSSTGMNAGKPVTSLLSIVRPSSISVPILDCKDPELVIKEHPKIGGYDTTGKCERQYHAI
ncbi:hypothetical protein ACFL4G_01875 [Thermodesulfobacteriota bacterium]